MIRYTNNTDLDGRWIDFEKIEDYVNFYTNKYIKSNYNQAGNLFTEETKGVDFKNESEIIDFINQTVADQLQNYEIEYEDWSIEKNQGILTLIVDSEFAPVSLVTKAEKEISELINSQDYNKDLFRFSVDI